MSEPGRGSSSRGPWQPTRRGFNRGLATAGAAGLLLGRDASAEDVYPSRAVTIVAPTAPGGPTDVVSRASAQRLQERFRQNFIVENRPGAAGNVAAQVVAHGEPDGYTLIMLLAPLAQNQAIYRSLDYNLQSDFAPLAHMASTDLMIAARPDLPASNLAEFIAYLRAHPGAFSCGSQSPPQMAYLQRTLRVEFTVAPYKGSAPIASDLIAKQIDIGLLPYADAAQHIEAGAMKPLFTCGPKRIAQLPRTEAVCETFPGFSFWSWYGVAAPAQTPEAVRTALRTELVRIARSEDFRAFLTKVGLAPVDAPEDFAKVIGEEVKLWKRLVDELNLPRI